MFSFFNSKIKVIDSGILNGFTDSHSHLLPGVDDGFKTAESSLKTLSLLEQSGVKAVWLTPHVMEDYPNTPDQLRERFQAFTSHYTGGLQLHLAAEHMIDSLLQQRLDQPGQLLPHQDDELLVETSYYNPPYRLKQTLQHIQQLGYHPLLAHPERYQYMTSDDYQELHAQGIRFQLNLPSLVGAYGPEAQHKAEQLLTQGIYTRYGLDLHSYHQLELFLAASISKKLVKRILL